MIDLPPDAEALFDRLDDHWTVLRGKEREIGDMLVEAGLAERKKQARRNFPPMYRRSQADDTS